MNINMVETKISLCYLTNMSILTSSSASLPSRAAIWLGIGLVVYGFLKPEPAMTVIGTVLILLGSLLWAFYKPPKSKKSSKKLLSFFERPIFKKLGIHALLLKIQKKSNKKDDANLYIRKSIKEGAEALDRLKKTSISSNPKK